MEITEEKLVTVKQVVGYKCDMCQSTIDTSNNDGRVISMVIDSGDFEAHDKSTYHFCSHEHQIQFIKKFSWSCNFMQLDQDDIESMFKICEKGIDKNI